MTAVKIFAEKLMDKKQSVYSIVNIILTIIVLALILINYSRHLFIREAQGLSPEASKRDFCSMAMNQVITKKLSKKIITESLYSQVVNDNYKNLYFEGEEVVDSVFTKESICKVIVKTKDGIRSFDFTLEESGDSEFYYLIKKIHESELYEKGA
ncbi:MAG: hypothetical protein K2Q18_13945 [Bdellovibrionales bacterium]|nr:hypothetical protein [Bdellovibrionales bacterium]